MREHKYATVQQETANWNIMDKNTENYVSNITDATNQMWVIQNAALLPGAWKVRTFSNSKLLIPLSLMQ